MTKLYTAINHPRLARKNPMPTAEPTKPAGDPPDVFQAIRRIQDAFPQSASAICANIQAMTRIIDDKSSELNRIKTDVRGLHERRCMKCDAIHWHADHITPYVCCPVCGCQDTRIVKELLTACNIHPKS